MALRSAIKDTLTGREMTIAKCVADGKTSKEIASFLGIAYKTVDTHRSNIMKKLGLHNAASVASWAVKHAV